MLGCIVLYVVFTSTISAVVFVYYAFRRLLSFLKKRLGAFKLWHAGIFVGVLSSLFGLFWISEVRAVSSILWFFKYAFIVVFVLAPFYFWTKALLVNSTREREWILVGLFPSFFLSSMMLLVWSFIAFGAIVSVLKGLP